MFNKRSIIKGLAIAIAAGCLGFAAAPSQAVTLNFDGITNNVNDPAIEAQVTIDITDNSANIAHTVKAILSVSSGVSMAVANLYVDDNGLFSGINSFVNGTGVKWGLGGSPGSIPAGNNANPDFNTNTALDSGALAGAGGKPAHSVNPGENVTLIYTLAAGKNFSDVLDQIANGDLRFGIHVIGIDPSVSAVTHLVPEPASMATLGLGLGLVALRRRRKA